MIDSGSNHSEKLYNLLLIFDLMGQEQDSGAVDVSRLLVIPSDINGRMISEFPIV